MDVEDIVSSEVAIAVAATAAVLSSRVRRVARRGLVYGVAGALSAGDMMMSFGKGVASGVQDAAQSAKGEIEEQMSGDRPEQPSQNGEDQDE